MFLHLSLVFLFFPCILKVKRKIDKGEEVGERGIKIKEGVNILRRGKESEEEAEVSEKQK
jgi:hypothetical protein